MLTAFDFAFFQSFGLFLFFPAALGALAWLLPGASFVLTGLCTAELLGMCGFYRVLDDLWEESCLGLGPYRRRILNEIEMFRFWRWRCRFRFGYWGSGISYSPSASKKVLRALCQIPFVLVVLGRVGSCDGFWLGCWSLDWRNLWWLLAWWDLSTLCLSFPRILYWNHC